MWVSWVLGDDHYKLIPRVTVDVAHYRTLTAQWSWVQSICQNSQPLIGNGVVSIWVEILEWDEKPKTDKQTIIWIQWVTSRKSSNKQTHLRKAEKKNLILKVIKWPLQNLKSLYPRMLYAKLDWNCPVSSAENFKNFVDEICFIVIISPI